MTAPSNPYDQVPYTSYPYERTHPDRLCAMGRLFGLSPRPIDHCRVLELGCASGGNMIPLAELLPQSVFIGVDRSHAQIQAGQATIEALGLPNIKLIHGDILEIDASWGLFDYIICHGVYSWIPAEVQTKILEVMEHHLQGQGLGYISYNVYPGWHQREMVRDMMRYRVRAIEDPQTQTKEARAFLDFLGRFIDPQTGYGQSLQREIALLQHVQADYIFHEHLERDNHPIYFHEFADRLAAHHLSYVGETDLQTMLMAGFPGELSEALHAMSDDIIALEQYMDFVRNRQFRTSVICRAQPLQRALDGKHLETSRLAYRLGPNQDHIELDEGVAATLRSINDVSITTTRAITKAALAVLHTHWPRAVELRQLGEQARALLEQHSAVPEGPLYDQLRADLLAACFGGDVQLRSWDVPVARTVPERPEASRVARHHAASGDWVPSLRHTTERLDRAALYLLPFLDGKHTHADLARRLEDAVKAGTLTMTHGEETVTDARIAELAPVALREILEHLRLRSLILATKDDAPEPAMSPYREEAT